MTAALGGAVSLEDVARLIQLSLSPVFLMSALAALLGVFATRLAKVDDRVQAIAAELETADARTSTRLTAEQEFQRRRTHWLDAAVVLGALGGMLTCASVLALFLGALTGANVATVLFALFGAALVAAIGALVAFGFEMLLASRGVRLKIEKATSPPADAAGSR